MDATTPAAAPRPSRQPPRFAGARRWGSLAYSLGWVAVLLAAAAAPAGARQAAAPGPDPAVLGAAPAATAALGPSATSVGQNLFVLDLALYAAGHGATEGQRRRLHALLLGREGCGQLERAWPLRQWADQQVAAWPLPLRQRLAAFFVAHPLAVTHYHALAVQLLGPPPAFAPRGPFSQVPGALQDLVQHRAQLAELMAQIWAQQGGAQMWAAAAGPWQALQPSAQAGAELAATMAAAMGVAPPATSGPPPLLVVDPLMAENSAVTSLSPQGGALVVVGPTATAGGQRALLAHELAHPLLQRALAQQPRLRRQLAAQAETWRAVLAHEDPILTAYVYTTYEDYFSEVVIRALVARSFPDRGQEPALWLQPILSRALASSRGAPLPQLATVAASWARRQPAAARPPGSSGP